MEKNVVKLRFFYTLLIPLFCVCGHHSFASDTTINLPFKIQGKPYYNNGHLYGVTQKNNLIKYDLSGNTQWSIEVEDPQVQSLIVKFNNIFLLDKNRHLTVYSTTYGFVEWKTKDQNITSFQTHYPFVFYISKNGSIGALDFETGYQLWTKGQKNTTSLVFFPHRQELLTIQDTEISLRNILTGERIKRFSIGQHMKQFIPYRSDILFKSRHKIFSTDLDNVSLLYKLGHKSTFSYVFRDQLYISFNEPENKLIAYELKDGKHRWEKTSPEGVTPSSFYINDTAMLIVSEEKNVDIINLNTGESVKTLLLPDNVVKEDILGFINQEKNVVFYTQELLFNSK